MERLKGIQNEIHQGFIALVQARRGAKLDGREKALFSGEFWSGSRARELGLVDALGDLRSVLRARYGDKVKTPLIAERGWLNRRTVGIGGSMVERFVNQSGLVEETISALEARALWARYGL